jgi:hypothetical protein
MFLITDAPRDLGEFHNAEFAYGWLAPFIATDNPVSSGQTQTHLGWKPIATDLRLDILRGTEASRKDG